MSASYFLRGLAVAWCLFTVTVPKISGAPDITIKDVLDAWKKRQDRVRTCRFEWETEITYPKGSLLGSGKMISGQKASPLPVEDTKVKRLVTLTLDGNQMRYTSDGPQWYSDKERFVDLSYVSVCDGAHSKSYYGYRDVQTLGFVNKESNKNIDASNGENMPILMTYRALDPLIGIPDINKMVVSKNRSVFQDRECLVLEAPMNVPFFIKSYWVDPGRDYSIVRQVLSTKTGAIVTQATISYQFDGDFGWVPVAWDDVLLNERNSKLRQQTKGHVNKYEFNVPIDQQAFKYDFPSETVVLDHEEGKKQYVMEKDGSKRYINSLNDVKRDQKQGIAWRYALWAVCVLAVAGCILAVKRYLGKRRGVAQR